MSAVAEFLPLVGILIPAAISSGPNNNIVLYAAAKNGLGAVLLTILAVITGSSVLFAFTSMGLDASIQYTVGIKSFFAYLGIAYLTWLGLTMFKSTVVDKDSGLSCSALPTTFLGVSLFQIANPKAWVMMGFVSAYAPHTTHWSLLLLIVVLVFSVCLTIWAIGGKVLSQYLRTSHIHVVFSRTMGLLLMFFAVILLFQLN